MNEKASKMKLSANNDYGTIFKEYAISGNKSLMNLNQFNSALEYIGEELYPTFDTKYDKLLKVVSKILGE